MDEFHKANGPAQPDPPEVDHATCPAQAHDFDYDPADYGPDAELQAHDGPVRKCNGCGALSFYCRRDENHHHGGADTPSCFLVQEEGTRQCVYARALDDRTPDGHPYRKVCVTHDPTTVLEAAPCPHRVVYGGFTEAELSAAFDTVKTPGNWKRPIDALVDPGADRRLIEAAVIFYTGSVPSFATKDGRLWVVASGYYAEIGS